LNQETDTYQLIGASVTRRVTNSITCFWAVRPRGGSEMYRGADKSLARPGRNQATFPAFYGTGVHYHIHKTPPPVPTLAKSIHPSAHHTFNRRRLFLSWSG